MDFLADARRRAFSFWLRTGRLPRWARGTAPERKYNPWHDPDDGRFTFAGTGRYFGRGGSASTARSIDARMANRPREPFGGYGSGHGENDDAWNGGGASGREEAFPDTPLRRGSNQQLPRRPTEVPAGETPQATVERYARIGRQARAEVDNPRNWRRVEANGYVYRIDPLGRTRRVTGTIYENPAQGRSPSNQQRAGGPDRRSNDHGGHFIARRFNGPTEAFNHFAQDASFNRRAYSRLENQWSRSVRAGKRVQVKIEPVYEGSSQRPSMINVRFWTDGHRDSLQFPNEARENPHARR